MKEVKIHLKNTVIDDSSVKAPAVYDKAVAITGALVPVGIAVGNTGFEAVIVLTSLIWIFRAVKFRDVDFMGLVKHPVILPSIMLYGVIIISTLLSGVGVEGYLHDFVTLRHLLYIMALIDTSNRFPVWKYLFYGIIAGAVYACVNILCAHMIGYDFVGKPLERYTSKLKEGNRYPTLLAFLSSYFLAWGMLDSQAELKKRVVVIAAGLIMFAFLSIFQIKTVLLAFIAGIFFTMCFILIKKKSYLVVFFFILMIFIALLVFSRINNIGNFDSFYERVYIWIVSFQIWLKNPLFGVGISSYSDAFAEVVKLNNIQPYVAPSGNSYSISTQVCHAHNNFLQILSCTGIAGLVCSLWLAFNVIRLNFKNRSGNRLGLIPWPIVYFTISLAGFSVFANWYQAVAAFVIVTMSHQPHQEDLNPERFY